MKKLILSLLAAVLFSASAHATTLEDVKARGKLLCGVNPGLLGFADRGGDGAWAGFDVDFCRAVAAAVLGDAAKVDYVALTAQDRFDKLTSGAVDVLARNTTWTMERETKFPLRFVGVNYMDGQGFLVSEGAGGEFGVHHEPGGHLLSHGHHDGSQCGGFLPRAADGVHAGEFRQHRQGRGRL